LASASSRNTQPPEDAVRLRPSLPADDHEQVRGQRASFGGQGCAGLPRIAQARPDAPVLQFARDLAREIVSVEAPNWRWASSTLELR
jgi:hypothetical protein